MAVSRAPRSPQKAMAVLLGLALVFSLLLIAVSRESDLHVVHDRTGGHFEHDHHRVFDSHGGVSSLRGGAFGGERARAHLGDLARGAGAHGAFSSHRPHGATVGGSESSAFGEARAGGFGGAGGAVGGDVSSVRSRSGFEAAQGGDGGGDADDRFLGGGSTRIEAHRGASPTATPKRRLYRIFRSASMSSPPIPRGTATGTRRTNSSWSPRRQTQKSTTKLIPAVPSCTRCGTRPST